MNHSAWSVLCVSLFFTLELAHTNAQYHIEVQPEWHNLGLQETGIFEGKWIWAGTVTFHKKSKRPLSIGSLDLKWTGDHLEKLEAELFTKEPGKDLEPTEENIISDGQWNNTKQTIHFNFNKRVQLQPVHIFCLVLTLPKKIEQKMRTGHFEVQHSTLPHPFNKKASQKLLSFAVTPKTETVARS